MCKEHWETMWTFKTARFEVRWEVQPEYGYRYDGDDPEGEVQAKLDAGDYVAFVSKVAVYLDGEEVTADYLGGSVYEHDKVATFRDHIGMNAGGYGSYFSDMVREACRDARKVLGNRPKLRAA
jgi:hypothetical protein